MNACTFGLNLSFDGEVGESPGFGPASAFVCIFLSLLGSKFEGFGMSAIVFASRSGENGSKSSRCSTLTGLESILKDAVPPGLTGLYPSLGSKRGTKPGGLGTWALLGSFCAELFCEEW